ncbi:signal peptidase I [Sulfurivermis fontis]|uniref:signal peptidase I n=1 Tax=Sulfurivermis fontis TaxID=1972068 RepID=UPI000FDA53B6|nr:signal peptidase I [Sulfurivermis fontis]
MPAAGHTLPIWRRPWREQLRLSAPWLVPATVAMALAFLVADNYVAIGPNRTGSLSIKDAPIIVVIKDRAIPGRGELVAFTPDHARYYQGYRYWVKRVVGLPGDVVTYAGDTFYVNGKPVATTKPHAKDGRPLTPGPTGALPECRFFVATDHPDGYDSRYSDIGWVSCEQIVGRAYALP